MKRILIFLTIIFIACNNNDKQQQTTAGADSVIHHADTNLLDISMEEIKSKEEPPPPPPPAPKIYSNARFKDVVVEQTSDHRFLIKGKAQVFEANISWVVEDGHDELKKGFQTTDAGAPAWGNFTFNIDVQKKRQNSTLTLILFESSAKDGSRQHELPIVLY